MARSKRLMYHDSPEVRAAERPLTEADLHREFMDYCARQARELGVSLQQFMTQRNEHLQHLRELKARSRILNATPQGPILSRQDPTDCSYHEACSKNIQAILSGSLTVQDAATSILSRFPGISHFAQSAWATLADSGPVEARWREIDDRPIQADVQRPMSTRAYELANEIVAEVERKMAIGAP